MSSRRRYTALGLEISLCWQLIRSLFAESNFVQDVNFFSLITLIKASLPALRKSEHGGRIVMISSGAAVKGTPGWAPYNASKAAMNSLCR